MDEEGERVVWKGEMNEVRMRMRGRKWKRKYEKIKQEETEVPSDTCVCVRADRAWPQMEV